MVSSASLLADLNGVKRAVVVAPHPDDESIGCGGLLALLAGCGARVHVIVATDGGASHPNSRLWRRQRLARVRRSETTDAVQRLGISARQVTFLDLRDGDLPTRGSEGWCSARARLHKRLKAERPDLLLLPWRRDPHADHRAVSAMALECLGQLVPRPRVLEYPVWLDENGASSDYPDPQRFRCIEVPVEPVLPAKRAAIAAHRTQTTDLVHDDPDGFRLAPAVVERALAPVERYFEAIWP